jgi:hypothetical protein
LLFVLFNNFKRYTLKTVIRLTSASLFIFIALIFFYSCDLLDPKNPKDDNNKWEYGNETTYLIKSQNSLVIIDTLTGYKFEFPKGSDGNLTVIEIKKGPEINITAKMFGVTYTGKDTFKIIMPHKKGSLDFLYEYKAQTNAAIDRVQSTTRWWGVPNMVTTDTTVIFTIISNSTQKTKTNYDNPLTNPMNFYAFGRIPDAVSNEEIIKLIKQGINEMVQHFADTYLSGDTKQKFLNNHKLINIEIRDVSDKEGSSVAINKGYFSTSAIFWFTLSKGMTLLVFPHETGHYINYLLSGYDRYQTENDRFGYDFHVAFKVHSKQRGQGLKEDIAYFYEPLLSSDTQIENLTGSALSLWNRWNRDPQSQEEMNTPVYQPSYRDFPGVEGFAAMIITSLTATNNKCYNFMAIEQKTAVARKFDSRVPVIGMNPSDVIGGILLRFPKNINELYQYILDYLQDYRKEDIPKFYARIEPLGWSYNGTVKIVNESGKAVPKAQILPVIQTGQSTRDYWTDFSLMSDKDGICIIPWLFPGQSLLRVFFNDFKDSADFPCNIDLTKPTNETIDLGVLTVKQKDDPLPAGTASLGSPRFVPDTINIVGQYKTYTIKSTCSDGTFNLQQKGYDDNEVWRLLKITWNKPPSGSFQVVDNGLFWKLALNFEFETIKNGLYVYTPNINIRGLSGSDMGSSGGYDCWRPSLMEPNFCLELAADNFSVPAGKVLKYAFNKSYDITVKLDCGSSGGKDSDGYITFPIKINNYFDEDITVVLKYFYPRD